MKENFMATEFQKSKKKIFSFYFNKYRSLINLFFQNKKKKR